MSNVHIGRAAVAVTPKNVGLQVTAIRAGDTVTERSAAPAAAEPAEPDDIVPFTRRNTPNGAGYAVAAFTALGVGSVLVPAALHSAANVSDFLMGVGAVLAFGFIAMIAIGLPLTLLAHLALRRVRYQIVHIAAFGVVGLLTGYLFGLWLVPPPYGLPLPVVLAVGLSAAAGRATVNHRPR